MEPTVDEFLAIVSKLHWTFAKTYAKSWPHDYVVRGKSISPHDFSVSLAFIEQRGTPEDFYATKTTYLRLEGLLFWVTADGEPRADPTAVLNRTYEELSYKDRLANRTLPGQEAWEELHHKYVELGEQGLPSWRKAPGQFEQSS